MWWSYLPVSSCARPGYAHRRDSLTWQPGRITCNLSPPACAPSCTSRTKFASEIEVIHRKRNSPLQCRQHLRHLPRIIFPVALAGKKRERWEDGTVYGGKGGCPSVPWWRPRGNSITKYTPEVQRTIITAGQGPVIPWCCHVSRDVYTRTTNSEFSYVVCKTYID